MVPVVFSGECGERRMRNPYSDISEIKKSTCTPAQEALKTALIQLLGDNQLRDITVKELCGHAFTARSTFYAYYNSIDEVLEDIENDMVSHLTAMNQKLMSREIKDIGDMTFFSETLSLISDNKTVFYILLVANPDYRFIQKWKDAIKYHLWERIQPADGMKNVELVLEMTASAAIGAYTFWLTHPYEVEQEGAYFILSDILKTLDQIK